jgi:hypothetical protein
MCKLLNKSQASGREDCKTLKTILGIVYAPFALLGGAAVLMAT